MSDINKTIIIGRLTRDVGDQFGYTSSGTARANISIACNESVKSNRQWENKAHFFDVTIWGKTAENLKPYLTKGKQVAIVGRLKQDRWTDQQSGQNRTKVYINAEEVQLLGGNSQGNNGANYQQGDGYQQQPQNYGGDSDYPQDLAF